jgi:hypothetical protein
MGPCPTEVTVIHPFHPFYGKRLEFVRVTRRKSMHFIILRSPDGSRIQVRSDWTDYDGQHGTIERTTSSLLLDIRGLREATTIVEHLKMRLLDEEK